ncbi:MAG: UDP-glucose dehydrogenase family protein [Actinomycetota bacterium]
MQGLMDAWIETPIDEMKVAVIGTGHVGLITCVSMAAIGHSVYGMDIDEEKIAKLNLGISPFYEPGIEDLLSRSIEEHRLSFTSDPDEALGTADVIFICVGTPARANGEANLIAVEQAARAVARHAKSGTIVIEKSTVPAGTASRIEWVLRHERIDLEAELQVASNPEFLREGSAMRDALFPERILIGADSAASFSAMRRLYNPMILHGSELIETNIATAELSKHACNAFLAMKISYINGLARLCELTGADVTDVARVMGSDPRIGAHFLEAGLGYGGFCFPKDLIAFEKLSAALGYDFPLLGAVARINEEAIDNVMHKIKEGLWNLDGKRIALLGLAFKPETDDVRFSPALALASRLLEEGAEVVGYDPQAGPNAIAEVPSITLGSDPYEAIRGAHCIVVCTEWAEFYSLDLPLARSLAAYPILVDGRNVFDLETVAAAGFLYYPTGRPAKLGAAVPERSRA